MDIAHLRYVVAVAEEGHFTAAAAEVGVAQSSVSWAVSKLESELGVPLFERTTRTVRLTAHGRAFLPAARRALTALDTGIDVLNSAAR